MTLTTQIGSSNEAQAVAFRDRLVEQHKKLKIKHPLQSTTFSDWENPWALYEAELHLFEAIRTSDVHIVANTSGQLTDPMALQILYAMLHQKPVVLLAEPQFDQLIDTFARRTLRSHQGQFTVADLTAMPPEEVEQTLAKAKRPVHYLLDSRTRALINTNIRRYFRSLLEDITNELTAVL